MKTILIGLGLGVLLCVAGCRHTREEHHEAGKLLVTSPVVMDTSVTKTYVCQIHSFRHIEIRAQERGYLEGVYVDEGKAVVPGQRLFQIMPRLYEAELQKAKAELRHAEIEYRTTRNLADSNIVAPNELALVEARYDKAKAEVALAETHLDFTRVVAPFGGIVDRLHVRVGSLIEEGELLTHLSDNSQMWVYFNVPETEYLEYMASVPKDSTLVVDLILANGRRFEYPGRVETIEADFNNETGNIAFRATFLNPDGLLRHGETGTIELRVPHRDALLVPQKATFEILEKKFVFVVDDENRVHSREIKIAAEMEDLYIVASGLSENEKILLEGLRKARDNDRIEYAYSDPREVIRGLKVYAE